MSSNSIGNNLNSHDSLFSHDDNGKPGNRNSSGHHHQKSPLSSVAFFQGVSDDTNVLKEAVASDPGLTLRAYSEESEYTLIKFKASPNEDSGLAAKSGNFSSDSFSISSSDSFSGDTLPGNVIDTALNPEDSLDTTFVPGGEIDTILNPGIDTDSPTLIDTPQADNPYVEEEPSFPIINLPVVEEPALDDVIITNPAPSENTGGTEFPEPESPVIVVTGDDPDFQFPDDTPPVTEPNPPVLEVPVDTEPAPPIVEEPIVDDENGAINITGPASSENTAGTDIPEPESPITGDGTPPVEPNPPVLEVPIGIGPISPVQIPEIDLPSTVTLEPSGVIPNPLPSSVIDPPTDGSARIGSISAERVGVLNSRVTDLNGPSLTAEELADIKYIKSYLIHETWSVSLGTKLELQEGDSLSSLAKEFGVSDSVALDVLRGYNPQIADVSQIIAGNQIYLPTDVLAVLPNSSPIFDGIIDPKTDGSEAIGNLSPDRVAELNARLDEIDGPPLTPKELAEIHHISRHLNHDRSNRWAAETGAKLTIEPGYNLEFFAQEFGVSQEVASQAVLDYNPQFSRLDQIKVGDSINIPLAAASNLPEASIIRRDVDSILDRVDWAQAEISAWAEDAGYRIEDSLYQTTGALLSGVGSVQRSDFVQSLGIADIKKVSVDFSGEYFKLSTGGLSIEESQNLYLQQTGNEISRETIEILFTDPVKSREILMNDPEIHKQYRDILNNDLPRNINEAINNSDEWKQLLPGEAVFHGSLTRGNQKFISQDGYREVIFNPEGNLVSHNVLKGTFNFFHPTDHSNAHVLVDVDPYVEHGN